MNVVETFKTVANATYELKSGTSEYKAAVRKLESVARKITIDEWWELSVSPEGWIYANIMADEFEKQKSKRMEVTRWPSC